MKTLLMTAALALASTTPALAIEPKPAPQPTADAPKAPLKKTRYCVMTEPATGTRIPRKVCQTRDAWLSEGFDPLANR